MPPPEFPGSVPIIFMQVIVLAQHIDTEFYDTHFKQGAYIDTHTNQMGVWHDLGRLLAGFPRPEGQMAPGRFWGRFQVVAQAGWQG